MATKTKTKKQRDWDFLLASFQRGLNKTKRIKMGSAGSAQVTAVRLRATYDTRFTISSKGHTIFLEK